MLGALVDILRDDFILVVVLIQIWKGVENLLFVYVFLMLVFLWLRLVSTHCNVPNKYSLELEDYLFLELKDSNKISHI